MWVGMFVWDFTRHGQYLSAGTWTWQISTWLYPFLFLGVGYAFTVKRVRGWLPRLFWAMLLTVMAYMTYIAVSLVANWVFVRFFPRVVSASDRGLWTAFGREWIIMGVVLLAFTATLGLIDRSSKRR